mmetsp:Transcript_16699/g.22522  ORF Transcript_16699/g.22522 Transcript_16699/m.22522 type:complete len:274 (-) Transcript_16699:548-1369(-)
MAGLLAHPLGVEFVLVFGAVEEHAHVGIHAIDGEHEPNDHHYEAHIDDRAHRLEQGCHNHAQLRVVRDDSQGSNHAQHAKHFQRRDVCAGKQHVNDRGYHDKEVQAVPGVAQVRSIIHCEAESGNFENHFENEQVVEDAVELLTRLHDLMIVVVVDKVGLEGELGRRQGNEQHDKPIEVAMLLDIEDVAAEAAFSVEQIDGVFCLDLRPEILLVDLARSRFNHSLIDQKEPHSVVVHILHCLCVLLDLVVAPCETHFRLCLLLLLFILRFLQI